MTDINVMRVSGDTLSHLLLLTSEFGAGPEDSPQIFCMKIDEKRLLKQLFPHYFKQSLIFDQTAIV